MYDPGSKESKSKGPQSYEVEKKLLSWCENAMEGWAKTVFIHCPCQAYLQHIKLYCVQLMHIHTRKRLSNSVQICGIQDWVLSYKQKIASWASITYEVSIVFCRYEDVVKLKDFTTSWRDGLGFNAIIHSHKWASYKLRVGCTMKWRQINRQIDR